MALKLTMTCGPYDRARAAVAYGPIARALALKLKYGRRPGVALSRARPMSRMRTAAPLLYATTTSSYARAFCSWPFVSIANAVRGP